MAENSYGDVDVNVAWWKPVLFAALAGGLAWGIRGQYGHETGAMIAGLLVALTLTLLLCPKAPSWTVARAVAWTTVAIGFGGTMTYGQTLGLTQNPAMIGNHAALAWGMLGTGIKGALWIGFAGLFLGMGLGGVGYKPRQLLVLMLAMIAACYLGAYLLNAPHDPENKRLPLLYFSASWYWEPDAVDLDPRREFWGGLLFALAVGFAYAGALRKDALAWRMGLWGLAGGALGFPLGQCLQAFHAWNPSMFQQGFWVTLDPHINWWNMMETTFGATMGALLGLGLWLNRRRIAVSEKSTAFFWPSAVGVALLAVHVSLLALAEFGEGAPGVLALRGVRPLAELYDLGLIMAILPIVAIAGNRWWPYLLAFPITALTIAGKTVLELVYEKPAIGPAAGWLMYLVLPMAIMIGAAIWFARRADEESIRFTRPGLLLATWTYFLLNFAFFRYSWPWSEWTSRTPNAIIFAVCAVGLTYLALTHRPAPHAQDSAPDVPSQAAPPPP